MPLRRVPVAELCVVSLGFACRLTTLVDDLSAEVMVALLLPALAGRSEPLGCEQAPGLGWVSQRPLPDTSGRRNQSELLREPSPLCSRSIRVLDCWGFASRGAGKRVRTVSWWSFGTLPSIFLHNKRVKQWVGALTAIGICYLLGSLYECHISSCLVCYFLCVL